MFLFMVKYVCFCPCFGVVIVGCLSCGEYSTATITYTITVVCEVIFCGVVSA